MITAQTPRVRIDKWLWAVRLFKTRSLAQRAIEAGHVRLNENRTKPSHLVVVGDCVAVRQGSRLLRIVVEGTTSIRRTASIAQAHYAETEESLQQRADTGTSSAASRTGGRPTKQNRRRIDRFRDMQ